MEGKKRFRPTLTAYREMEARAERLKVESDTLKASNKYMEAELKRLRAIIEDYKSDNEVLRSEIIYLEQRGFWARLFNL